MKYLFIFLPFFAMAQGGDSTLYGTRTVADSFITLSIPRSSGFLADRFELYYSDYKPKVVESFKYLGAYYELRDNGWYKEILPDTIPDYLTGDIRIKGDSVFRYTKPGWIPCDQHIGKSDSYQREKLDTSEVKLLVWTGCSLTEISATKLSGYNLDRNSLYYDRNGNTLRPTKTDFLFVYISGDKWIKPSHIIKEL